IRPSQPPSRYPLPFIHSHHHAFHPRQWQPSHFHSHHQSLQVNPQSPHLFRKSRNTPCTA
ncbi:hypothetical protein BCR44DRAFT_1429456, partial [Catenaria anguillulae PL171]